MKLVSAKLSKFAFISLFLLGNTLQTSSIHAEQLNSSDKQGNSSSRQQLHSHQNIIHSAQQFLDANIDNSHYSSVSIQMGNLDPRLRLTQCEIPVTATLAPGSQFAGKTTVHIRCNSTSPWTVYLSANIKLFNKVIQTAEPLTKGHILKKDDLIAVEEDLGRLKYGYFVDAKNLIGKQLKRRLPQHRVIKANYVKSPTLVKRGELVSIIAESKGYSVKMTGTAMMNGAKGDRIRVKNVSSKRIIEGTIKESGIVSIN